MSDSADKFEQVVSRLMSRNDSQMLLAGLPDPTYTRVTTALTKVQVHSQHESKSTV